MQRLFGIETEYGITIENKKNIDPVQLSIELIKSYRQGDFRPMWDYDGEDPFRDERGFRASELQEHPDERQYQEQDRQRNLAYNEIKSDMILVNGARLYNDHAHPEYSTPECRSLFELIAHDKAGERILRQCAARRSEKLHREVLLYKNNTDFHGHSYGCHDNYLMKREIEFDYLKESIMPFFVTRQIFAGAGKVGIETESGISSAGFFQLAQRSDFFHVEISVDTMHNRPIVNTRDEPHADAAKYRRLHGIVGDANMSEYSTALKLGTTALVISLIEKLQIPDSFAVNNPTQTIKEISRDQTYEWKLKLNNGRIISAIDLQREYLNLAQQHFAGEDSETDWVLTEWESVLDRLEKDPMSLADSLDWVAKKWLLETFIDEEGVSWDDPWLQSLDLEYHNINQDKGLYYGLQSQGSMRRVVTNQQIEHAIHHPPSDTRAYFRGKSLNKFSADVKSIQWDNITFNVKGKPVFVCMKKLADPTLAAEYNRVLNNSSTVESLVDSLGIRN
ncbi:MAG: depupylase/deamidase Dop [Candidatus Poribacteria bacterium]|nr:depupylase/deamidase Dop [Candidatus Poribacteria bacterium]MDE0504501.1 depupylase/deamidase Dop [Candidatus Poribacteria bacterium]